MSGGHVRPAIADQRAVLAVAAAILTGAGPQAAHDRAAPSGTCPACTIVASLQLGFALCASLLTGAPFVTPELLARLLELVEHAQAELEGSVN